MTERTTDKRLREKFEDAVIKRIEFEHRFFDTLASWIEAWSEENDKVIRLRERLQNKCLSCGLAISHDLFRIPVEAYLEEQDDIIGFFSQVDGLTQERTDKDGGA